MEHEELLTTEACTLPTTERPLRLAEFEALFADHLAEVSWAGERLRLSMTGGSGLHDVVTDLTARESACCSFFAFTVARAPGAVVLEVGVPPERREILDSLAVLARGARR
jgi:hypothetical protein